MLLVMAVTTIALAGILVLYLQGHRQRVNGTSSSPKAASSCDTPPAAAPAPPPAAKADAPPDFLTFAACGDDAKTGKAAKPAVKAPAVR
jgi:hypothetical protein